MNIDLIAKLKSYEFFASSYCKGDEQKKYSGISLLYYSLSNNNLEARYKISIFLLNKNIDVSSVNDLNETPLHILLGQVKHNLSETILLCKKLIERKVDINILDKRKRVAFQYVINMGYSDLELTPLYDLWFSQPKFDFLTNNFWNVSPFDLVRKLPFRKNLLLKMQKYITENHISINKCNTCDVENNDYIEGLGGCIVSNNILSGAGKIKWIFREKSINDKDTGWRFISEIDDEEYINNSNNLSVCDFNSVIKIEPATIRVYSYPIGSEFELIVDEHNKSIIINSKTKKII
jgi:hypothetical protein